MPSLLRPLAFCLLPFAFCLLAWGQYSIDWSKIAGGGGTSTNGQYSVSGTIGQPDAGTLSGGNFTLQGGFWSVVAVQAPGAPYLSVTNLGLQIVVSWPMTAESWSLECTNVLTGGPGPWTPIPPPYQTNAGVISVHCNNSPPAGTWFFRLRK